MSEDLDLDGCLVVETLLVPYYFQSYVAVLLVIEAAQSLPERAFT